MTAADHPHCEEHGAELLYDSLGYPYCPTCDDENWDSYGRHLVIGHTCDVCKHWSKGGRS